MNICKYEIDTNQIFVLCKKINEITKLTEFIVHNILKLSKS